MGVQENRSNKDKGHRNPQERRAHLFDKPDPRPSQNPSERNAKVEKRKHNEKVHQHN